MTVRTVSIGAGGSAIFPGGNVCVIRTAADPVTVEIKKDSRRVEIAESVDAGWWWEAMSVYVEKLAFDEVRVTSDTAQDVTVETTIGRTGYR